MRSLARRIVGLDRPDPLVCFPFCQEWFELIRTANRELLINPSTNPYLQNPDDLFSWKLAPSLMGADLAYKLDGSLQDLTALRAYFDRVLEADDEAVIGRSPDHDPGAGGALYRHRPGGWIPPVRWGEHAMQGYTLLSLGQTTGDRRYKKAADWLADLLLNEIPHTSDGCIPYRPDMKEVLVDTLAMICPFLARYASQETCRDASDLAIQQLTQFIAQNVDPQTHLPYHGYRPGGPARLGLHAWGRGTGWYMMGLVDTLLEMPEEVPEYTQLKQAFRAAADTLRRYQQPNGHWNWVILHQDDSLDSSTTALIGYSFARGIQAEILDDSFIIPAESAIHALAAMTHQNGVLDGSLGECLGLGKYPQQYGPRPWLQGAATAFAALMIMRDSNDRAGAAGFNRP